jgi:hypothetical protein
LRSEALASCGHVDRDFRDRGETEEAMTRSQDIRRHPDGAIDLDFYRVGATALRRAALRDASKLRKATAGALALIGMLAIAAVTASPPMRTMGDQMTAAVSNSPQTR